MTRSEPSLAPRDPAPTSTREPRPTFRAEPTIPRPARPSEPVKSSTVAPPVRATERPGPAGAAAVAADKNLAEMAQRLEAALRRPGSPAADRSVAPPVVPEAPATRPAADPALRATEEPTTDSPRSQFKNLEDEMASLLGRPKTPS